MRQRHALARNELVLYYQPQVDMESGRIFAPEGAAALEPSRKRLCMRKIDQSFAHDIGTDRNHTALITAIIAMANSLQLGVMAEGVESAHQARFLLEQGCRSAQGFYYSKAVPASAFSHLLHSSLSAQARLNINR